MRVIPRVTMLVYAVVLFAGLYYVVADISPGAGNPLRLAGFVGCMVVLFIIENLDRVYRRSMLLARFILYVVVVALDESGLSRILLLLVPFVTYLVISKKAGLWLAVASFVLLLSGYLVWVPGWYTNATYVSDVLMFCVGMIMALGMASLAASALRSQGYALQLIADLERARIARDLHDSLGHHLTAISVQLEKSAAFRERDPVAADKAVADAHEAVRYALTEVRASVSTLREEAPFDLPRKLADLVDGSSATLTVFGEQSGSSPVLTALYRAAQESLTNAWRHAQASNVSMTLTFSPVDARLDVVDDGKGFGPDARVGHGLRGMQERAELFGGDVRVASKPGKGTRITVTVPT